MKPAIIIIKVIIADIFHINRSEIMFDKIVGKENFIKLITVLLIASIGILALSILTDSSDGRKQIIETSTEVPRNSCAACFPASKEWEMWKSWSNMTPKKTYQE